MKKHLIAAAVAAAVAAPAMAQVSISGGVQTELANTGATNAQTGMVSGSGGINHLTFTATEDLGGGLKARAVLNGRFITATGAEVTDEYQNSFVELSGGFGAFSMGRHTSDSMSFVDPWGGSGQSASVAISGTGARNNNLVLYTTPNLSGVTVKLGTTQNAGAGTDEFTTAVINFSSGPVALRLGVEETGANVKTTYYGGTYKLPMVTLGVAYRETESAVGVTTDEETLVSFVAPIAGRFSVRGGSLNNNLSDTGDKWAVGLKYDLSKRTHVYGDMFKVRVNADNGFAVGVVHTF